MSDEAPKDEPHVIAVPAGAIRLTAGIPTLISSRVDAAGGEISVKGPSGQSVSRVTEDGRVSMTLQDAQDDEQQDENRVVNTFCQKQRALGFDPVSVVPRDKEQRDRDNRDGIDARVIVATREFQLQITKVPRGGEFRNPRAGLAIKEGEIADAVDWLRETIEHKAKRIPRGLILAIDAQHASSLATAPVVDAYIRRFGDPISEFDLLAAVWIVGPTNALCVRVGQGEP